MTCQCKTSLVCVGSTDVYDPQEKQYVAVPAIWVCPSCSRYGSEKSKQPVKDLKAWAENA